MEIRQIVQAEQFDDEFKAAEELVRNGFYRGAGAIAGVVLEKNLAEVTLNHSIKVAKENPIIADYNDLLKNSEVIDVVAWRFMQHLGDLRIYVVIIKKRNRKKMKCRN